ncbi:MBL fold metallo-hydrolase [Paenibacillus sp. GbtcB18]|uniref:MBL fold metallo-hydrolase n=1 Tax=Paenibacillus sp. GbtcB18 TaxID=2824763 RepID=UPI001C2F3009|nr:MBL fold metallo-hydrolase [Paenibacillus sp. GbtcB18]
MRIAEGIEMLELQLGPMTIHPVVVFDPESWTLIDTGMPGSAPAIMELARQAGIGDLPLSSILLTHQDIDHIGGLPGILADTGGSATVLAHPGDEGAINGTQPMLKMTPERLAGFLGQVPAKVREQFERTFLNPSSPNVDRTFSDGETLPYGGGLTVIHTPGHTPGHVSLYHAPSKTLIAGDAMVAKNGELTGPNPAHTPDMGQALESLKKFAAFDIDRAICFHGGLVQGGVNESIARVARQA